VRLARVAHDRWAVKGGMALETRLGEHARVTVDLDADHIQGGEAARADLQRAAVDDVDDHFAFALVSSEALQEVGVRLAIRYGLASSLAGRPFEPVQVDVTIAPPEFWDAQPAQRTGLLAGLGLDPINLMLVPLERQVAEKLHACTRTCKGGGTTRVRDLVDLQLIRKHEHVDPAALRDAILHLFERRATHIVPERLPPPPRALGVAYRREAERIGLVASLDEAYLVLADWLDPVLAEIHQPDTEDKRPGRR
jgi:hypothetical protein